MSDGDMYGLISYLIIMLMMSLLLILDAWNYKNPFEFTLVLLQFMATCIVFGIFAAKGSE